MNYLGYTNTKFFYYYYLLEKPPLQTPVTREAPAQAVLKAVHRPRFSAETPSLPEVWPQEGTIQGTGWGWGGSCLQPAVLAVHASGHPCHSVSERTLPPAK